MVLYPRKSGAGINSVLRQYQGRSAYSGRDVPCSAGWSPARRKRWSPAWCVTAASLTFLFIPIMVPGARANARKVSTDGTIILMDAHRLAPIRCLSDSKAAAITSTFGNRKGLAHPLSDEFKRELRLWMAVLRSVYLRHAAVAIYIQRFPAKAFTSLSSALKKPLCK